MLKKVITTNFYLVSYDIIQPTNERTYDRIHSKLIAKLKKLDAEDKLKSQWLVKSSESKETIYNRLTAAPLTSTELNHVRLLVTKLHSGSCISRKLLGITDLDSL